MRLYIDDCPNIDGKFLPPDEEQSIFSVQEIFDEWQPFRLNINIIGYENRFNLHGPWYKHPHYQYKNWPKNKSIFIK